MDKYSQNDEINDIISQNQFSALSNQVNISVSKRVQLLNKLYQRNNKKVIKSQSLKKKQLSIPYQNKYMSSYLKWKQQDHKIDQQIQLNIPKEYYTNTIKKQEKKNKKINPVDKQQIIFLKPIKADYQEKLKKVLQKKSDNFPLRSIVKKQQLTKNQKLKKYNNLNLLEKTIEFSIKPKQSFVIQRNPQTLQLESMSFQNMIRKPPSKINSTLLQQNHKDKDQQKQQLNQNKHNLKLDIEGILKIPHRKFLIFFERNIKNIIQIATVDQLSKIVQYRDQAIRRYDAVQKLRLKVSQLDKFQIQKLPKDKIQKLYKVLYQQEQLQI